MIFVIPSATTAPFNTMARSKSSKSSGTCCNLVMALLTLWSMVSLIVIVVWATSPHMKGVAQCNVAQQVWTTVCLLVQQYGALRIWVQPRVHCLYKSSSQCLL